MSQRMVVSEEDLFELLSFMGAKSVKELPDYESVNSSIESTSQNLTEELKNEAND